MYGPFTSFWSKCSRCGDHYERDVFVTFAHDVRCWGWRTAWYTLRHRGG